MKKNTFTVLFSKVGVVLFFLMFLLWNQGSAQSYVTSNVAQTRLGDQAGAWIVQARQDLNSPTSLQLRIKSTIYDKMIQDIQGGATVTQAIDGGMQKYVTLCKDKDPVAVANMATLLATFQQYTQGLLTN